MRFHRKCVRRGSNLQADRKLADLRHAAWQVFGKRQETRQVVAQPLERRTLFAGTPIPIVDPGFETLYEPGTDILNADGSFSAGPNTATVTALPGGVGTLDSNPFGPSALLRYQVAGNPHTAGESPQNDIATVQYSDGTSGTFVDVPGWTAPSFPATYGGVINVGPQINTAGQSSFQPYPGKSDSVLYLNGPGATSGKNAVGPGYQVVSQQLTTDVQPNTLYMLTVQVGTQEGLDPGNLARPIIANVEVGGTPLTLLNSNMQQVVQDLTVKRTNSTSGSGTFKFAFNDPAIPQAVRDSLNALAQGTNLQIKKIDTFQEFGQTYYFPDPPDINIAGSDNIPAGGVKSPDGVKIEVDASGNPVGPGTFQTLTETFYTGNSVPANSALTITLGTGPQSTVSSLQTNFDNVSLSSASADPQSSAVTAAIQPPVPITTLGQSNQTVTVTYSSSTGALDANAVQTLSVSGTPASSAAVTGETVTGNVATLMSANHFTAGQQVNISGLDKQFNGTFTVTAATPTSFSYSIPADVASTMATGSVASVATGPAAVTNEALLADVVTLTANNNFVAGQQVTVSGVGSPFDGTFTVSSATSTAFSYTDPADIASAASGGTADNTTGLPLVADAVTNKALAAGVATLTADNDFTVGEQVIVSGVGSPFNGTFTVTAANSTSFSYFALANVPSTPARGIAASAVTNKALAGGVATLTVANNFTVGQQIAVSGVDSTFNGIFTVTAATPTTFSYVIPTQMFTSKAGNANTFNLSFDGMSAAGIPYDSSSASNTASNIQTALNSLASGSASGTVASATGGPITITGEALASDLATVIAVNSFTVGQQITISGLDSQFDGTFKITAATPTTFSYYIAANVASASTASGSNPLPTVAPIVVTQVTQKALAAGVATLTFGNNFVVGEQVTVSGVDSTFNGTFTVTAATPTSFSYRVLADIPTATADGICFSNTGSASATIVTNKALTMSAATLTAANNFTVGQTVTVSGVGSPFDGTVMVTAATGTSFSYIPLANVNTTTATGTAATAITNKALTAGVVTLTAPNNFTAGQQVVVAGVGKPFDGTVTVTAATATTFSYLLQQNVAQESASGTASFAITKKSLSAGVATLTADNNFTVGEQVTISGVDTVFNGTHTVTAVAPATANSPATFSYAVDDAFKVTSIVTAGATESFAISFPAGIPQGTTSTPLFDSDSNNPLPGGSLTLSTTNAGIIPQNVVVVGPSGDTLPAALDTSTFTANGDESVVTATYLIQPPDGATFTDADNGTYTVLVAPGAVTNNTGFSSGISPPATFIVNIAPTPAPALVSGSNLQVGFTSEAVITQPDGTTVIAGHNGYPFDFTSGSAAQLEIFPSGSTTGTTITPFAAGARSAFFGAAIVPQGPADAGDIIAVGTKNGDMVVVAFKPDGSLDTNFGTQGVFLAGINGDSAAYSVAIDPSGKIVVGATNATGEYVFFRLNADGTPDVAFNAKGANNSLSVKTNLALPLEGAFLKAGGGELRITSAGQGGNAIDQIVIQPGSDGVHYNILAAGTASVFINGNTIATKVAAVLDVDSTGAPDSSFGLVNGAPTTLPNLILAKSLPVNGLAVIKQLIPSALGSDASKDPVGIALESDGHIVVVAGATDPNNALQTDFGVARIDSLGNLDPTFGTGGVVTTPFQAGGTAFATSVSIMGQAGTSAERIVVSGVSYGTAGFESAFAVYNKSGQLDTTGPLSSTGTLALPTGISLPHTWSSFALLQGLTVTDLNGDGTGTYSTSAPANGSSSTSARIQFVSPFPQLAASGTTVTTDTDMTSFDVVYTSKAGAQVDATKIDGTLTVQDVTDPVLKTTVPVTATLSGIVTANGTFIPANMITSAQDNQTVDAVYVLSPGRKWLSADSGIVHVSLTSDIPDTTGMTIDKAADGEFGTFMLGVVGGGTELQLGPVTTVRGNLPAAVAGQSRFLSPLQITVTNVSGNALPGQLVEVHLFTSLNNNTFNGAVPAQTRPILRRLKPLAIGQSETLTLRGLNFPSVGGDYYILASISTVATKKNAAMSLNTNVGATAATIHVAQPVFDLMTMSVTPAQSTLHNGVNYIYAMVENVGNTDIVNSPGRDNGTIVVSIANDKLATSSDSIRFAAHLAVGKTARVRIPFLVNMTGTAGSRPELLANGPVKLQVSINLNQDGNDDNNTAVSPVVTAG